MFRFLILMVFIISACNTLSEEEKLVKQAMRIHKKVVTIDSHTDTPLYMTRPGYDFGQLHDARKHGSRTDLPRMEQGNLDAAFFAVFLGQGELSDEGFERAFNRAEMIFDSVTAAVNRYSDRAEIARKPEDVYNLKNAGKKAIYIGLENGYPIGFDLSKIEHYYHRGARYITLCHTRNNQICDSSTDTVFHNGLSDFGKQMIRKMNRLGMMIDVSHISDKAFYDVINLTSAPVIASHSSARAICDNPRNLTDDMLLALAENGGVVQVCLLSSYVKEMPPNPLRDSALTVIREKFNNFVDLSDEEMDQARKEWRQVNRDFPPNLATVSDLVDHIDHIVSVAGIDFVGIGSDFDGGGGLEDCYDVSQLPNITIELVKRGYSEEEIRKIWGENLLRVMRKVQNKAT
jgi:membrane dipeptidase